MIHTGPLINNTNIESTYSTFQNIIKQSPNGGAQLLKNWRFLAYWFRALVDKYIQEKLQFETALQVKAEQVTDSKHTASMTCSPSHFD